MVNHSLIIGYDGPKRKTTKDKREKSCPDSSRTHCSQITFVTSFKLNFDWGQGHPSPLYVKLDDQTMTDWGNKSRSKVSESKICCHSKLNILQFLSSPHLEYSLWSNTYLAADGDWGISLSKLCPTNTISSSSSLEVHYSSTISCRITLQICYCNKTLNFLTLSFYGLSFSPSFVFNRWPKEIQSYTPTMPLYIILLLGTYFLQNANPIRTRSWRDF